MTTDDKTKRNGKDRDESKDRHNSSGARLVAGCVCLSNTVTHPSEPRRYVLLISSSRHREKWVLPKGGWEKNESAEQAAMRECYEEAGVVTTVDKFLIESMDVKKGRGCEYRYFQTSPTEVLDNWPEKDVRTRRWVGYNGAVEVLAHRPEMVDAINASDIHRP